jgi:hypothetical protein
MFGITRGANMRGSMSSSPTSEHAKINNQNLNELKINLRKSDKYSPLKNN